MIPVIIGTGNLKAKAIASNKMLIIKAVTSPNVAQKMDLFVPIVL